MKVGTCKFFEEDDHHCHSCISISIGFLEFYNIINIFAKAPCHLNSLIIKSQNTWQHITCSFCSQKSDILVASDNTYMSSQRMKEYFIDFFFIQNLLSFAPNVNATCPT
jgi:hypothetical protein